MALSGALGRDPPAGESCCGGFRGAVSDAHADPWDLAVGSYQWQVLSGVTGQEG